MKTFLFNALVLVTTAWLLVAFYPIIAGRSGITGHLYLVKGNQMPSPDVSRPGPAGVKGTFYVYELTKMNQATRQANTSFFTSVSTRLIREVNTKRNGAFKVKLPPGRYSIFIKTAKGLYSNLSDGEENIGPVEVTPNQMTRLELKDDHEAVY